MKILSTFLLCFIAVPLIAQVNTGELRLKVTDSTELGLKATVALSSEANQYFSELTTDADGTAEIKTVAYGVYRLDIEKQVAIAPINTVIEVSDAGTLLDPNRPSSTMQIGSAQIEDRVASLPGRSVQDFVNSQLGWHQYGPAVINRLTFDRGRVAPLCPSRPLLESMSTRATESIHVFRPTVTIWTTVSTLLTSAVSSPAMPSGPREASPFAVTPASSYTNREYFSTVCRQLEFMNAS